MKRSTRVATAAVAAALSVGIAAPAIAGNNGSHPDHGHHQGAGGGHSATDRAKQQVLRDIAQLDTRLARVVKDSRVNRLAPEDKDAVTANVVADRAALTELAADVKAADTTLDLKQVRRDLKGVRVQNYVEVVNDLRFAAHLADQIADLRGGVTDGSPEAAALNEADADLADARAAAHLVTAHSTRDDLRAVRSLLAQAKVHVDAVADSSTPVTLGAVG